MKKRGRETVVMPAKPTERLFNSVGLVKSDWRGRFLDRTLIDVMWAKQVPELNLKERNWNDTHTHTYPDIHTLTIVSRTHTFHCH